MKFIESKWHEVWWFIVQLFNKEMLFKDTIHGQINLFIRHSYYKIMAFRENVRIL